MFAISRWSRSRRCSRTNQFTSYILFIASSVMVYAPLAHGPGIRRDSCLRWGTRFAGGTVVHILAVVLLLQGAWFLNAVIAYETRKFLLQNSICIDRYRSARLAVRFNAGHNWCKQLAVSALFHNKHAAAAAGLAGCSLMCCVAKAFGTRILIGALWTGCHYTGRRICCHSTSITIGVIAAIVSNIVFYYKQKSNPR